MCRLSFFPYICAILLLSTAPFAVLYSQEETVVQTDVSEDIPALDSATATGTTDVVDEQVPKIGHYPTVSIPGDIDLVIGDFVVGPGKVDLSVGPNESRRVEMTVTNRTGEVRRFRLTTEDAQGSRNPGKTLDLLGDVRGPYSLKDYISFPHESFELEHNKRAVIPITISIPPDAEPGGLYGSVLVETVSVKGEVGGVGGAVPQSAVISRIGTLFFITVPGDVERDGALKDFTTIPPSTFFSDGPIRFGILFENKGSIHLTPYGEVEIRNIFDDEVGFVELEPWFVLPDALRLRELSWTRDYLFGKYTAIVRINRSYDDIIDTMEYTFWVLPWKIMLGAFAVLFGIIFVFRFFFRTFEFKRKRS